MDNDNLHLDVEVQLEDLFARAQRLRPRRHEHAPVDAERLDGVDHLAEFGAPPQHAEL